MPIGGLDIGSTGAKITVMNKQGNVLHTGYRDYPVSRHIHAHEVDGNVIRHTVKQLLKDAAGKAEIDTLGISSFGESFVLLDENDKVLLPVMMYTDPRGQKQTEQLRDKLGADAIAEIAGTLPHPMFSLPKLMWVRDNLPEVFAKVKRVCLIGDYICYMLTGNHFIDYSLAARTLGFDVCRLEWSKEIFAAADISTELFGKPVPSGSLVGNVRQDLAQELGLCKTLPVVLCGQDQITAAVGSGAFKAGTAVNGAGTVECITPIFSKIPDNAALQKHNYPIVPFLDKGDYCCFAFSFTGGSLVKWFVNQIAQKQAQQAKAGGKNVYDELSFAAKDEPSGILVLPHFAGAATPYMDTGSKGVFAGLSLTHTTTDMYRGVMEGIACESMVNLETLAKAGLRVKSLQASGGCARSAVWLQIKADIWGVPVTQLATEEAGTVGSIMMAGVATGRFASLEESAKTFIKPLRTFLPRPEMHEQYQKQYSRYRRLYRAVRPLMEEEAL